MTDDDRVSETITQAEPPSDMPLPSEPQMIFLGGLFALAMLTAAYAAREIILPLAFAIMLKLLLQPVMRLLERAHLPRTVASLLPGLNRAGFAGVSGARQLKTFFRRLLRTTAHFDVWAVGHIGTGKRAGLATNIR